MPIDHNYIRAILERFEGKGIARGYVPMKNGEVLGVSGVTIATGVDLGQQTGAGLLDMGVPHAVVKKLLPYIGLKKAAALPGADLLRRGRFGGLGPGPWAWIEVCDMLRARSASLCPKKRDCD